MASFDFINYEECENWFALAVSIAATVEGLQEFIRTRLKQIQDTVKLKRVAVPQCNPNKSCSVNHKNDFRKWCTSCQTWRNELKIYHRGNKSTLDYVIKWDRINSYLWSSDLEEIAKVFVNNNPESSVGLLYDLSSLLSIFRNCTQFSLGVHILKDVSNVRNIFSAHNSRLKLSQNDKISSIDTLKCLLQEPDIASTKKANKALLHLGWIQISDHIIQDILDANTKQIVVRLIDSDIEDMELRRELLPYDNANEATRDENEYPDARALEYIRTRQNELCASNRFTFAFSFRKFFKKVIEIALLAVVFHLIAAYWNHNKYGLFQLISDYGKGSQYLEGKEAVLNRKPNCLHMYNKEVLFNDWDFYYDIQNIYNESIIEREWLSSKLFQKLESSKKGVLIASDMGFGKSSIVSLLVCSPVKSSWFVLRKNLLAYHICRYDVETTKQPHIFVRNLASMLMKRFTLFNSAIEEDDSADLFFIGPKCEKDPIGCLEILVLKPLRQAWKSPINETKLLMVLDAADECSFADGKIDVASLISHKLQHFPSGFKIIITTRHLLRLKNSFISLNHFEMQSFSDEIDSDLKNFANIRINTNKKDTKQIRVDVNNLVKISEGNFLLLRFLIESYNENGQEVFAGGPTTLFQFYTLSFKRLFGRDGYKFYLAKRLFEIICTSEGPLSVNEIFSILNHPESIEKRELMLYLRNEMSHFLKFSKGSFSLLHKSLRDYFLSLSDESTFYIELNKGHERFAHYLMANLGPGTWIKTAFHVAHSDNEALVGQFANLSLTIDAENIRLDSVVAVINSYSIMQIWEDFRLRFNVQSQNDKNESLAFIASKVGHLKTLRWLIDKGADIQFEKRKSYMKYVSSASDCKYVYYCGYNLIEIAAQNGHFHVLKFLLTDNQWFRSHKTLLGLTALDLACENGHLEIAKYLINEDIFLPTQHSLYLAAKNNHLEVAQLLLQYGIKDVCVPCNSQSKLLSLPENGYVIFPDDSHFVFCETALHVAVRFCQIEVIRLLGQATDHADNCYDVFGMTPLLSSVRQKCEQAFIILYEKGTNSSQVCIKNYNNVYADSGLEKTKHTLITENICPEGWNFVHLTVNNDISISLAQYLISKGFKNWDAPDKNGVTPYHLAHCYMDNDALALWKFLVEEKMINVSTRSLNGSTPFHTMAYCRNIYAFAHHKCLPLWNDFGSWSEIIIIIIRYINCVSFSLRDGIPDVVDNENKTILYYFFSSYRDGTISFHYSMTEDGKEKHFKSQLSDWVDETDIMGNHSLYYAVRSRKWNEAWDVFKMLNKEKPSSLFQVDYNNFSILDYMFQYDFFYPDIETLGTAFQFNSPLEDILQVRHAITFSFLFDKQRALLNNLSKVYSELHIGINGTHVLQMAVSQSNLLKVIILRRYFKNEFIKATSNPDLIQNITNFHFKDPFIFLTLMGEHGLCIERHMIHKFSAILKIDNYFKFKLNIVHAKKHNLAYVHSFVSNSYKFMFNNKNSDCLNSLDKDGYNFLHKSIMEGNIMAIRELIKAGADITILSKLGENVLDIAFKKAYYIDIRLTTEIDSDYCLYYKEKYGKYDDIATELLFYINRFFKNSTILNKENFCTDNQKRFGYVHLAAAKGLFKFLKEAHKIFGRKIINCRNYHNITPFDLADINLHYDIKDWLGNLKLTSTNIFGKPSDPFFMFLNHHFYTFNHHSSVKAHSCRKSQNIGKSSQNVKSTISCIKIEIEEMRENLNFTQSIAIKSFFSKNKFKYIGYRHKRMLTHWIIYKWTITFRNLSLIETLHDRCYRVSDIKVCKFIVKNHQHLYSFNFFIKKNLILNYKVFLILTDKMVENGKFSWFTLESFYRSLYTFGGEYSYFKSLKSRSKDEFLLLICKLHVLNLLIPSII